MDENWRKAFGTSIYSEICDGAGVGICNGMPSTCSSLGFMYVRLCDLDIPREKNG